MGLVNGKQVSRLSFVPLTRDDDNKVVMLDPDTGDGAALVRKVRDLSIGAPLEVDGREVVLIDRKSLSAKH
jgi:hypothetical protein